MDGDADSSADGEIDALVALRAEVASLRARLAEKDHRTSEFVARLAHELRTPLGAILMWAHVLRLGRDADRDTAIDAIETSARAESKIIGRLLDVSRASAGRLKINRAILDLRQPVREALEEHRSDAHAHGVGLEVAVGEAPMSVNGDADRIREIVSNLVSNGIKFTPAGRNRQGPACPGSANTRGSLSPIPGLVSKLRIFPMSSPHFGERVTPSFGRARVSDWAWPLARLLTELHEGTIRADSEGKGRGTTFTIDLPLTAP